MTYIPHKNDGPIWRAIMSTLDFVFCWIPGVAAFWFAGKNIYQREWAIAGLFSVLSLPWLIWLVFIIKSLLQDRKTN